MGNQIITKDPIEHIKNLDASPEEKKNILLYFWRAASHSNQHIPRTFLNFNEVPKTKETQFACMPLKNQFSPNVTFEDYVCDFRPLVGCLDFSQLLTLFRMVLKGHQAIYSKLNSSLISEKCCFLTHNGQIRTWINPNYYLNEFWTLPKKQFILKISSPHEPKCQTPRFMNKEEFDFHTAQILTSQATIITKLVEWIPKFSKKSTQTVNFWAHLHNFIKDNMYKIYLNRSLNNCNFQKIEKFINFWAYQLKVTLKSNLQDVVKKLIQEKKILKSDSPKNQFGLAKKLSYTESITSKKSDSKKNFNDGIQSNGISVLDIKNCESHNIYMGDENLSRLLGTSVHEDNFFKSVTKGNKEKVDEIQFHAKRSIKRKRSTQESNFSKQNHHPQLWIMTDSMDEQQQIPSTYSEVYQNIDTWSVDQKDESFQNLKSQKSIKKELNYSYQYSINLHASQVKENTQNYSETMRKLPRESKSNKDESQKPGPILKRGHTKSFQSRKDKSSDVQDQQISWVKKIPSILEPSKNYELDMDFKKHTRKSTRLSTFRSHENYAETPIKQSFFKHFERSYDSQKQNPIDVSQIFEPTKKIIRKIPQNSDNKNFDMQKTPRREFNLFNDITNYEISSKKICEPLSWKDLDKSIVPEKEMDRDQLKVQASMMVEVHHTNDDAQGQTIKSKRSISARVENVSHQRRKSNRAPQAFDSGISTMNHPPQRTPKTITGLFSYPDEYQTSFGSISSQNSNKYIAQDNQSKYSGILSKMGRSVQFRKIPDDQMEKLQEFQMVSIKKISEEMPSFKRKRSIHQHGRKRSMKV